MTSQQLVVLASAVYAVLLGVTIYFTRATTRRALAALGVVQRSPWWDLGWKFFARRSGCGATRQTIPAMARWRCTPHSY